MYVKKLKKQVNISLESPCIVRCGVGISIYHSSQDFFLFGVREWLSQNVRGYVGSAEPSL